VKDGFKYQPPDTGLAVIHVDDDILVVNKPAGLLSVPGRDPAHRDCLESRVRQRYRQALLVHRLDMDTSGVMVFAMHALAQRHLGLQFERRQVLKEYEAVVEGMPVENSGLIDLPLIVDWPNRPLQKVCFETGRPAQTAWRVILRHQTSTRMLLAPTTGRSHQLRVHMKAIGHVILGDRFYAEGTALAAAPRLMLHAKNISLAHPNGGEGVTCSAACPF